MLHNCNEPRGRLGNCSGIPARVDTTGNDRKSHGCARQGLPGGGLAGQGLAGQGLAGQGLAGKCVALSAGENACGDVDQGPDRGGGLHGEAVARRDGNSGDGRERSLVFPGDHAICALLGDACHVGLICASSDPHHDAELGDEIPASAVARRAAPDYAACVL